MFRYLGVEVAYTVFERELVWRSRGLFDGAGVTKIVWADRSRLVGRTIDEVNILGRTDTRGCQVRECGLTVRPCEFRRLILMKFFELSEHINTY